jgi:TolB-like protein
VRSKRSPILVGLLAVLLFTLAVVALVFTPAILRQTRSREKSGASPAMAAAAPAKSIAVLPFENLSEDKGSAYFVAGMQDEILTALAKIRELKVISKTSTAKYRSRPDNLKAIAQELGVAAILEGSVQKLGDAVHITVQLIDGRNDAHLWADSYDRELKNVFGMEREVAETVASKLKAELSPQDATELSRVPTTNAQAYDRYLKGEYAKNEFKAAPARVIPAPIYIGLRTKRYGPRITSFLGGSNGAGVPFPMNTKVNTHQSAIAVPIVTIIIPATCGAPVVAGSVIPDHDRNRLGR